jgi:hypothetical protein
MSKTYRHILFTVEPVKPRNRIAVDARNRRGGAHVKPYGSLRQTNKQALLRMIDETETDNEGSEVEHA